LFEPGLDNVGFEVEKPAVEQVFLRELKFPLSSISLISSYSIIWDQYSRPYSGLSNIGLGSTPPPERKV
jgi:hypothetical protein